MVWIFFNGPIVSGQINHLDGNKENNSINNLELVTAKENIIHAVVTGLNDTRGEKNARAKLTDKEVAQIKRMLGTTTQRNIANIYGVHESHISAIKKGRVRTCVRY
jgi:hypothetical protein